MLILDLTTFSFWQVSILLLLLYINVVLSVEGLLLQSLLLFALLQHNHVLLLVAGLLHGQRRISTVKPALVFHPRACVCFERRRKTTLSCGLFERLFLSSKSVRVTVITLQFEVHAVHGFHGARQLLSFQIVFKFGVTGLRINFQLVNEFFSGQKILRRGRLRTHRLFSVFEFGLPSLVH